MLHRPPRAGLAGQAAAPGGGGAQANGQVSEAAQAQDAVPPVYNGVDVYDPNEADPACTRAIESSLWELEALSVHAVPTVSTSPVKVVILEHALHQARPAVQWSNVSRNVGRH